MIMMQNKCWNLHTKHSTGVVQGRKEIYIYIYIKDGQEHLIRMNYLQDEHGVKLNLKNGSDPLIGLSTNQNISHTILTTV